MQHLADLRLQKAKELLAATPLTLADIAAATGFGDSNHLGKMFRRRERTSPSAYRKLSRLF